MFCSLNQKLPCIIYNPWLFIFSRSFSCGCHTARLWFHVYFVLFIFKISSFHYTSVLVEILGPQVLCVVYLFLNAPVGRENGLKLNLLLFRANEKSLFDFVQFTQKSFLLFKIQNGLPRCCRVDEHRKTQRFPHPHPPAENRSRV